jgi:catechol 2,3-dioxygenase-like lactoylglutathione lyase family enzyme
MHRLHHIGYWVDDLDTALTDWDQGLGVGPFQVIKHVPFEEFVLAVGEARYRDVVFDHSAAFAAWGPVVVELNQVHAIDDRLAAAYGIAAGAVSHVSWVVPDVEQESARLARLGCRLINTARSGPISVAWHDGGSLFPHPIELHQENDVIAGMHDRLVALRAADDRLRRQRRGRGSAPALGYRSRRCSMRRRSARALACWTWAAGPG